MEGGELTSVWKRCNGGAPGSPSSASTHVKLLLPFQSLTSAERKMPITWKGIQSTQPRQTSTSMPIPALKSEWCSIIRVTLVCAQSP